MRNDLQFLFFLFVSTVGGCSWSQNAAASSVGRGDGGGTGSTNDSAIDHANGIAGIGLPPSGGGSAEDGSPRERPVDAGDSIVTEVTGPILGKSLATFDSSLEGFSLNTFAESTNLALAPSPATIAWIATDGSPDLGCVKIVAPYSGPNQWVDLEARTLAAPTDWTGKILHVRIKLDPTSTFSGSARLYVKTGTNYFFYPNAGPLRQAVGWQDITLPLVSPPPVPPAIAGADPAQVMTFGVDPETTSVPTTIPNPVVFYVDSFSIE